MKIKVREHKVQCIKFDDVQKLKRKRRGVGVDNKTKNAWLNK